MHNVKRKYLWNGINRYHVSIHCVCVVSLTNQHPAGTRSISSGSSGRRMRKEALSLVDASLIPRSGVLLRVKIQYFV